MQHRSNSYFGSSRFRNIYILTHSFELKSEAKPKANSSNQTEIHHPPTTKKYAKQLGNQKKAQFVESKDSPDILKCLRRKYQANHHCNMNRSPKKHKLDHQLRNRYGQCK